MKTISKYFYPAEIITLIYIIMTALYMAVFNNKIDNVGTLLLNRLLFAGSIAFLALLNHYTNHSILKLVRYLYPLALIMYWYPETYYYNECIFPNLDPVFIAADQWMFGCQPSLEFSKLIPYAWFSELMSFGYFSYFLIIIYIGFYFYYKVDRLIAYRAVFITLCSFFMYYVLFIILPVVGPQFYFDPPLNEVPDGYLFRKLLVYIQQQGEKPTGAFPSSHVGMSVIFLILIYRYTRRWFWYFVPVVLILILSTVYIKAHYVIDVIGGLATAPLFYWLSTLIERRIVPCSALPLKLAGQLKP